MKVLETMDLTLPKICDCYQDKNIFITGVTGFIGKVLLEKLIRSVPTVKNIYVLLRKKRGLSLEERLRALTKYEIFEVINAQNPGWIKKVIPIEGDCIDLRLGISDKNWTILKENVSMIFHSAASVRFDDPLTKAILLNVRGTRELCKLALECNKLEAYIHISTTFCNNDKRVINEELYPPYGDWRKDIEMAMKMDQQQFNILTKAYTKHQPNTYTYTKNLAEQVVHDMCENRVPALIIRPSIVINSLKDPFPGWVDNFNGPVGFFLAVSKGVARISFGDPNNISDFIPVDVVIKFLIIAACWKATTNCKQLEVLNASTRELSSITAGELKEITQGFSKTMSCKNQLWYPTCIITTNSVIFITFFYILHLIPAVIVDGILSAIGKQPILLKIQRKIYNAMLSLKYFQLNKWVFNNDKMINLSQSIHPLDFDAFFFKHAPYDAHRFLKNAFLGGKKFLLKESIEGDEDEKRINKMYYVHNFMVYAFYAFLAWFLYENMFFKITEYFGLNQLKEFLF